MADGDMTYRGTDLRPTDGSVMLDLLSGYWEPPNVRGEDDVVPEASGREEGQWIADTRTIRLHGHVKGLGSTLVAQQQSFNSTMTMIMALFDRTLSPGALVVSGPYMGLATSPSVVSKTINARCANVVLGQPVALRYVEIDVELTCIDSPPDWT